ncbi:hypothetical protein EXIGLDRAFT_729366 [Exidia glandulosa HHB12029]|uniref:F-box domain-containing protein n=1 Tax=Exidia glandulosa HHB12029 TaxID=1314781 RepID=A0A165CL47_EXIGL|nr:hypothetical protein EXIGLDRAFT_729366 [Exidia glandulosa HHB12029]
MPPRKRTAPKRSRAVSAPLAPQVDMPSEVLCMIFGHMLAGDAPLCVARLVSRRWCHVASSVAHARVVIRGLLHIKEFLAAILADTRRPRGETGHAPIATTTFYVPTIRTLILVEPKSLHSWEKNRPRMVLSVLAAMKTALPRLFNMRRLVLSMYLWPPVDIQRALDKCPALESLEIRQVREVRPVLHALATNGSHTVIPNPFGTRDIFPTERHQYPEIKLSLARLQHLRLQVYVQDPWTYSDLVRTFFREYIGEMTELRSLAVNFCGNTHGTDPVIHGAVLNHTWTELRSVALVGLNIDQLRLWQFLGRHPLLEHIDWRQTGLVSQSSMTPPTPTLRLLHLRSLFFVPSFLWPSASSTLLTLIRTAGRSLERLMVTSDMLDDSVLDVLLPEHAADIQDLMLEVHNVDDRSTTRFLEGLRDMQTLELCFESFLAVWTADGPRLSMIDEYCTLFQHINAPGLRRVTLTVTFLDDNITPDDSVTERLLSLCATYCRSVRHVEIIWLRWKATESMWAARTTTNSFFSKTTVTWDDTVDGEDTETIVLRNRVDKVERQEPVEWDDVRPGCPGFSCIPSWY